jgi:hypothetical protein
MRSTRRQIIYVEVEAMKHQLPARTKVAESKPYSCCNTMRSHRGEIPKRNTVGEKQRGALVHLRLYQEHFSPVICD